MADPKPPTPKVPLPKKRMPPKVRAFRRKMADKIERVQEMVGDHIHAAQDGRTGPETPPEAAQPVFPPIPGLSEVKLSLDSQFMRENKVATRWTVYAIHSGPVAGLNPTNLEVTVTGMTVSTLTEDEQGVARQVSFYDQQELMKQLRIGV
jgi:hypothetical protein